MGRGTPRITVAVAAHKPAPMPTDPMYLPLQVGAVLHPGACPGFRPDDEGDSISGLNASYCELTGLYWMWRNCRSDFKGLVHYRRLLGTRGELRRAPERMDRVVGAGELLDALAPSGFVVGRRRSYYIETVYGHYAHTFDAAHLDACREVLSEMHPEALPAWDRHMAKRSAHICNMLVARADLFDAWCAWLFPVIGELAGRVDSTGLTPFEARWPGRVAERLLDPWLCLNGIEPVELPVVTPEPVDWIAKGTAFLAAKFLGRKYGSSF